MAAGDIKTEYGASAALTQTALDGLVASSTWVAGWTSAYIDNGTNKYLDYLISAKFQVESAGLTAGEIRVYVYTEQDDSSALDIFSAGTEGTEGAATLHDTEIRDSALVLLWSTATDTTASRVYTMPQKSLVDKLGFCPRKWACFVTQSTVAALETTGDPNQVFIKGVYQTIAQS